MLGGKTYKNILIRIKYNFRTSSNKNTVEHNILVQRKGAHCKVGVVKFMAVISSQRDEACF